jgi:hypothetical protein
VENGCTAVVSEVIAVCFRFEQYAQASVPTKNPRKTVQLPDDDEWNDLIARLSVCVSPKVIEDVQQMRQSASMLDCARQSVLVLNSIGNPTAEDLSERIVASQELSRRQRDATDASTSLRERLAQAARPRWWKTPEDQISWWVKAVAAVSVAAAIALIGVAIKGLDSAPPATTTVSSQSTTASTSP